MDTRNPLCGAQRRAGFTCNTHRHKPSVTHTQAEELGYLPLVHTWSGELSKQTEVSKIRQHSLTLEEQGKNRETLKQQRDRNKTLNRFGQKHVWWKWSLCIISIHRGTCAQHVKVNNSRIPTAELVSLFVWCMKFKMVAGNEDFSFIPRLSGTHPSNICHIIMQNQGLRRIWEGIRPMVRSNSLWV